MPKDCKLCGKPIPLLGRKGSPDYHSDCKAEVSRLDKMKLSEKAEEERLMALFRATFPNQLKRNYDMWQGFRAGYQLGRNGS